MHVRVMEMLLLRFRATFDVESTIMALLSLSLHVPSTLLPATWRTDTPQKSTGRH